MAPSLLEAASHWLPGVQVLAVDQLGEDAEQESHGAGDVHHDRHGDGGLLFQLPHLLCILRIYTQHSKCCHAKDEDGEVEKVDEKELVTSHLDVCGDDPTGVLLFVLLGRRTRCCYREDTRDEAMGQLWSEPPCPELLVDVRLCKEDD